MPRLAWVALFVAVQLARNSTAEDDMQMIAHIEAPENISFPGATIAAQCVAALQGFSRPAAPRRKVTRADILSILPPVREGAHGFGVGDVFVANKSAILGWLSQLHPGARPSRYHPLDPAARADADAVGVLLERSARELHFLFRYHAEFKVSHAKPALFVMPGSFEVSLRVSLDLSAIHGLHVHVPSDRAFNVLMECGDPFASLGDNTGAPVTSPDARRLSQFKIPFMRREPSEAAEPDRHCQSREPIDAERALVDDSCEDPAFGRDGSAGDSGEVEEDSDLQREDLAQEAPSGDADDQRRGRATGLLEDGPKAGVVTGGAIGASAKMGLQFFPGEDMDLLPEVDGEPGQEREETAEGEAAFVATLQTAVQEVRYPLITLSLSRSGIGPGDAGEKEIPSTLESSYAEARAKLAVALYPFLDAGYKRDYVQAFQEAAAARKPMVAVVLWGALDDASC